MPQPEVPNTALAEDAVRSPDHPPSWWRRHRVGIAICFGLWVIGSLIMWRLSLGQVSPRRYQDEFLWYGVGKSWAADPTLPWPLQHGPEWRGVDIGVHSPLYVYAIAPAFWMGGSIKTVYHHIQMLDAMMMCAVVFPVYWGARQIVSRPAAALAAVLALSAPALNYTGIIGTESLGYPLAAFALIAIVRVAGRTGSVDARATVRDWAIAVVALLLAAGTRTQFLAFGPVLLGAVVIAGILRGPGRRAEFFRLQINPLVVAGCVGAFSILLLALFPNTFTGLYAGAFDWEHPSFGDIVYWFWAFWGDVAIVAGIVPAIAVVAMAINRDSRREPWIGALIATALVAAVLLVLQQTYFSANNLFDWRGKHIFYERYMFYLGPLFYIGLVASWRRIKPVHVAIASCIVFFALAGLSQDTVLIPFSYDAFGLTLAGWVLDLPSQALQTLQVAEHLGLYIGAVGLIMGALLAAAAVRDRRSARAGMIGAAIVTFAFLAGTQWKTWYYARLYSPIAFDAVPKPVSWVDEHVKQPVGMIVTSTDDPPSYFSAEFWNRRIVRVFATDQPPISSPVMYSPRCEFDWASDGTILGTGCSLVPKAWFYRNLTVAIHLKNPKFELRRVYYPPGTRDPAQAEVQRLLVSRGTTRMISMMNGRNAVTGVVDGTLTLRTFADHGGVVTMRIAGTGAAGKLNVGGRSFDIPARGSRTIQVPVGSGEQVENFAFQAAELNAAKFKVRAARLAVPGGRVYTLL